MLALLLFLNPLISPLKPKSRLEQRTPRRRHCFGSVVRQRQPLLISVDVDKI
jgi:hypothetical protein